MFDQKQNQKLGTLNLQEFQNSALLLKILHKPLIFYCQCKKSNLGINPSQKKISQELANLSILAHQLVNKDEFEAQISQHIETTRKAYQIKKKISFLEMQYKYQFFDKAQRTISEISKYHFHLYCIYFMYAQQEPMQKEKEKKKENVSLYQKIKTIFIEEDNSIEIKIIQECVRFCAFLAFLYLIFFLPQLPQNLLLIQVQGAAELGRIAVPFIAKVLALLPLAVYNCFYNSGKSSEWSKFFRNVFLDEGYFKIRQKVFIEISRFYSFIIFLVMCLTAQKVYKDTQDEHLWFRQVAAEFGRVAVPNITKLGIICILVISLIVRKCLPKCAQKDKEDTLKTSLLRAKTAHLSALKPSELAEKEIQLQKQFDFDQNIDQLLTSPSETDELMNQLKIPLLNQQVSSQFQLEQEDEIEKIQKNQFIRKMTFLARKQKMSVFG